MFGLHSRVKPSFGGKILDVKFDPTGNTDNVLIASYKSRYPVVLYDSKKHTKKHLMVSDHKETCNELHFTYDGRHMVSGLANGSVNVWSTHSAKKVFGYHKEKDTVSRVCVHPAQPFFATAYKGKSIVIGNYSAADGSNGSGTKDLYNELQANEWPAPVNELTFGHGWYGNYLLASLGNDDPDDMGNRVDTYGLLFDINCPEYTRKLNNQQGMTFSVAWNPRQTAYFAVGSGDHNNNVCIYNMTDNIIVGNLVTGHDDINQMSWSPDGVELVVAGNNNSAHVFDMRFTTAPLHVLKHNAKNKSRLVTGASWSRDGPFLVTCGEDCHVNIWDTSCGDPLIQRLGEHKHTTNFVDVSARSDMVVSGSDDGFIAIYAAEKGVYLEDEQHQ
ncbi:hypothetical protein SAMD00019534_058430 [Acytostelium subglobosum LB1]|uniref:hypothetical protein n=1 Tax=Acytostelium subglobosum LB1 TaxID=1410327 RepID=UPI000644D9EE|nr:hypothetical protein SAMD00019534_058430 [Acytostelium subglobosum LB1]GAM22668.1 hypothetical protein SAMD00019534_058430 [Acytostelium subglobosum LB1]|eukprot:XP_012754788.1 hypothetical protein SAMD00019534_058430 [Acytostelium subglobosum LB1]